jgi:UDP-N-acetylglucosamine 1-carboxyvinyltransferase
MDYLEIEHSTDLRGSVSISGAKNSALPVLASTILAKNAIKIANLPNVADINTFLKLLVELGCAYDQIGNFVEISTASMDKTTALYDIVRKMRASILVLGPILARFGHCEVSLPGGCAIGQRPIDLHLKALEMMGAIIEIESGYVRAKAPKGLKGAHIVFDKITVTGTENIVMAAALAHGRTTILNAAKEPEVVQLCNILKDAGVKIEGVGTSSLSIEGTGQELLEFKDISIIPDRIEAGTYLCVGAITNSKLTIENIIPADIDVICTKLIQMGYNIEFNANSATIHPNDNIRPIDIVTQEHPGFPTDMQAQFMALATQANGTSIIEERLFENRFMHVSELQRFGAHLKLSGNSVSVIGQIELSGADVMATDLRASSALILAALVAKSTSRVHRIYHLDRGYDDIVGKLSKLGARVKRLKG